MGGETFEWIFMSPLAEISDQNSATSKPEPIIDLAATRIAFLRQHKNLSWSRLQQFERCTASWFVENFAVLAGPPSRVSNHRHAFPGTIIQRVWEAVVNAGVYRRPACNDPENLAEWCGQQARALFRLLVLPLEAQWQRPPENGWRHYFLTPAGEARRWDAIEHHGLDPAFRGHLQPQFVDAADIAALYGSTDRCLAHISSRFAPTLAALSASQISLEQIEAERFVAVAEGEWRYAGQIDFIVHTAAARPLADGYWLLDGKFRLGPTVNVDQLYFYALLLERAAGAGPGWLGFLDYGQGRLVGAYGDGLYRTARRIALQDRIAEYKVAVGSLAAEIHASDAMSRYIGITDLTGLTFKPGRVSCAFCSIAHRCPVREVRDHSR